MTTSTRPLLLFGLLALCACSTDLQVPKEAKITCAESGCPPGKVCRPEVDLCVTLEDIDTEPPRLVGEVLVDPPVGGPGTVFTVELTASEPLARDPEVRAGERPLVLRERAELTWAFTYAATGDEAEGGVAITIRLVDLSGNVADGLPGGTLAFDFTAPALVPGSARVDPSVARDGAVVRIGLAVDEVPDEAGVLVGGRPATAVPSEEDPTSLAFEYTVTGDDPEGEVEVAAWLADAAGNRREGLALGVVRVDTEPPEVLAREGPASLLRAGDEVTVLLTYTEPAVGEPEVRMSRPDGSAVVVLDRVVISPVTNAFRHTAVEGDHGSWELVLRGLADEAGNPGGGAAGEVALGSLEVDAVAPGLGAEGVSLLDDLGPHRRVGQPVRVAFATTEVVAEPQVVLEVAGGLAQPLAQEEVEEAGDGLRFVYGWTVEPGDGDGPGQVSVSLTDRAGNRGGPWASDPLVLDRKAPVLGADSLLVQPEEGAGIGRLLEVELSAGEALADATLRVEPAGLELAGPVLSGPRARWTRLVEEGDPHGRFDLVLTAVDLAGNEAELRAPGAVEVDGVRPGLGPEGAEVVPAVRRDGTRVRVVFAASEPLQRAPEVWIGGVEMRQAEESTPARLVYEHVVDAAVEQEGEHPVTAVLLDLAGNPATVPLGSVRYDFTAPRLTSTPLFSRCDGRVEARVARNDLWLNRPACPAGGPALSVAFSLSELPPPDAPPCVTVAGRVLELRDPEPARPSWVATLDPRGDEPQSSPDRPDGQPVLVESEDPAGNKVRLELGRVRFDFQAPRVEVDERTLARLTHVRDPWGSEGSGYLARMSVRVAPDALPEPAEIQICAVSDLAAPGADPLGAAYSRVELGAGLFTPGEPMEIDIGATDIEEVGFGVSDFAGNEADGDPARGGVQALPIRSVEWVGTLHGKRPGDVSANPHALATGYTLGDELLELDSSSWPVVRERDLHGVGRRDEVTAATADTWGTPWLRAGSGPSSRADARLASHRGEPLLFGGVVLTTVGRRFPEDETWAFAGSSWRLLLSEGGLSRRYAHAMAEHPAEDRVVLFGGCDSPGEHAFSFSGCPHPRAETWEWDGADWYERGGPAPAARHGHGMATAPGGEAVLLFGGVTDGQLAADTWAWNGDTWTELEPANAPAARHHHVLVWDEARDVVVLYGGEVAEPGGCVPGEGAVCGDTWEWDGNDWTQREPHDSPPALLGPAAVYAASRQSVLLFGGETADGLKYQHPGRDVYVRGGVPHGGTWRWDGETWYRLEPMAVPPARAYGSLGWDRARGGSVLFGGRGWTCKPEVEGDWDDTCKVTWSRTPAQTRPHLVAGFDLRTTRTIEPTAADPTSRQVLGLSVRTSAGGIGHNWEDGRGEGTPVLGYSVATSAPVEGGWLPAGVVEGAGPEAPTVLTREYGHDWSCGEDGCREVTLDRWLRADSHVHVDVAPLSPQGDSPVPGRIRLDYVELRVRYWRTGCEVPSELLPEGTPDGTPCSDGLPGTEDERCLDFVCVAD